jgi:hypothetical protein
MIEKLWKIYEVNKEWIKFADTKAIAFIAIIGVIFNILFKVTDEIVSLSNYNIVKILYGISIFLLSISLLLSVCCLCPRTSKTDTVDKKNVIYYKSINDNFENENDYFSELKESDANFDEQLSAQIYQLAKVATKKYCIVKWSLRLFAISFVLIIILMTLLKIG